jgi:hypothetical protein
MTEVRNKAKPIVIDIAIRNFIEEIILLTFLIKDMLLLCHTLDDELVG